MNLKKAALILTSAVLTTAGSVENAKAQSKKGKDWGVENKTFIVYSSDELFQGRVTKNNYHQWVRPYGTGAFEETAAQVMFPFLNKVMDKDAQLVTPEGAKMIDDFTKGFSLKISDTLKSGKNVNQITQVFAHQNGSNAFTVCRTKDGIQTLVMTDKNPELAAVDFKGLSSKFGYSEWEFYNAKRDIVAPKNDTEDRVKQRLIHNSVLYCFAKLEEYIENYDPKTQKLKPVTSVLQLNK